MEQIETIRRNDGTLTINRRFVELLDANGLTTFDDFMYGAGGESAKALRTDRTTTRLSIEGPDGPVTCYIKRHYQPPLNEYTRAWLRLTQPILGARNEWQALLRFHELDLPTMVPIAYGEQGADSFLMTLGLEGCRKLSDLLDDGELGNPLLRRNILRTVAQIAKRMHDSGLHHQDFYLCHLMLDTEQAADQSPVIYVIDLGRVRRTLRLSQRWIVKDLAQFLYSARSLSDEDHERFLEDYFDRPLRNADRPMIRRIRHKIARIGRHTAKNRL